MIRKLLSFILILSGTFLAAQHLELVWYKGQPPVDVLYDNDEEHIKMAKITHVVNFRSPFVPDIQDVFIAFRAHITNLGSQVARQVQLKVDHHSFGQIVHSLTSPLIDSIIPGDTTLYSVTLTDSIRSSQIWKDDFFTFSILSGNVNSGILDTIHLSVISGSFKGVPHSTDFGNYNSTFSTDSLGFDGYGYAFLIPFERYQEMVGISLPFGSKTIPGGDLQLDIYDSASFQSTTGTFMGTPAFTETLTIFSGLNAGPQKTDMYWSLSRPLPIHSSTKKKYWCVLKLYSNAGTNTIELYNDTTVIQPDEACLVYTKSTAQWVPISQGPDWLQNPSFTLLVYSPVFKTITISEPVSLNKEKWLFPNPAHTYFTLSLPTSQAVRVRIYNTQGEVVQQRAEVHSDDQISVSALPAGLYLVQFSRSGRILGEERLVVE